MQNSSPKVVSFDSTNTVKILQFQNFAFFFPLKIDAKSRDRKKVVKSGASSYSSF